MNIFKNTKLIAACAASSCAGSVFAHDVPGLGPNHWHASDALGYLVLGVLAAVSAWALWRNGGGK